jgi:hypothetical protein
VARFPNKDRLMDATARGARFSAGQPPDLSDLRRISLSFLTRIIAQTSSVLRVSASVKSRPTLAKRCGERQDADNQNGPKMFTHEFVAKLKGMGPFTEVSALDAGSAAPAGALVIDGKFIEMDPAAVRNAMSWASEPASLASPWRVQSSRPKERRSLHSSSDESGSWAWRVAIRWGS